ncbi:MAG: hypothetical protein LBJ71_02310 [Holosporaceae bacterium]|nr:hypothetical protein [Holosporaceae bacterium]
MANFDPKGNDIRISIFPNDGNFTSIIAQGFPGYTLHHFVLGDKQVMVRVYDPSMTVTPSRQGIFITPPTKKANREVTFNILGMPPEHKLSEIEEERRAMM